MFERQFHVIWERKHKKYYPCCNYKNILIKFEAIFDFIRSWNPRIFENKNFLMGKYLDSGQVYCQRFEIVVDSNYWTRSQIRWAPSQPRSQTKWKHNKFGIIRGFLFSLLLNNYFDNTEIFAFIINHRFMSSENPNILLILKERIYQEYNKG